MKKEITRSMETTQPFNCSDELIEQGVDNFRPILEEAGVFSPKNNYKNMLSHRKIRVPNNTDSHSIRTIIVEDISGINNVFTVKPGAGIKLETIARFVARANGARVKPGTRAAKVKFMSKVKPPKRDKIFHRDDN